MFSINENFWCNTAQHVALARDMKLEKQFLWASQYFMLTSSTALERKQSIWPENLFVLSACAQCGTL